MEFGFGTLGRITCVRGFFGTPSENSYIEIPLLRSKKEGEVKQP